MSTRLVAERVIRESSSSRSWRVVTVVMLLLGIAAAVVPRLVGSGTDTYTFATVEQPSEQLSATLDDAAAAGDFEIKTVTVADAAAAEQAVRDGDADVAVAGSGADTTMYVASQGAGPLPAIVSQAVVAESVSAQLIAAGLTPDQIASLQHAAPEQVEVGPSTDPARATVGFVIGIVIYLALILTGTTLATAVATEKSTRVSEVLLAVLKPTQLLNGTVAGVGLLGLLQVALLAAPVAISLTVGGSLDIPAGVAGDILLGVVWFVLGVTLYAFVYAALASLVEKVSEVGTALTPINVVLIGSYMLAIVFSTNDPDGAVSVFASLFPFSAPLVMPLRWASGLVPVWQLAVSMLGVLVTAALMSRLAAAVYARGIVATGRRLRLREVRSAAAG